MKRTGRSLLAALIALVTASCAEPLASVLPEPETGGPALVAASGDPDLSRLATFPSKRPGAVDQVNEWIGPGGGRLELQGFAIDVPAGAVDRATRFSIRLPQGPHDAEPVLAEFGPHSVAFARPVTIELPYAGTSIEGADASILWWDPGAHEWLPVRSMVTVDGQRLRTATSHFSLFGAGRVTRAGVTVSGG